ncbi:MAG TPA: type IV toxin-antitoxin system AbiEi family antitoxin domain-containing protein [Acidimicrobiales bacterium]|nr:type IV toxin-antitoxin system AbiEi family antitoxin domain-containing protein [Acidimicrobiales bacterium]
MPGTARRIGRIARAQHGLITRSQLFDAGSDRHGVTHLTQTGRLERLHPAIYRVAGAPETWEQHALAAALAADGVVSHRSAASMWGLLDADEIEITVPRGRLPRLRGAIVHTSADLAPHHVTRRHGLRITTPMRTLVDLGAVAPWAVPDAMEQALINRVCSLAGIERALDDVARKGRAGAGVLRAALDTRALGATRPDGMLEPRLARVLRDHGLPQAEFQYEVRVGGRLIARVDAAYPAVRMAIEVDGFQVHGTPSALQHDLERQNRLVAAGWIVLRFTWPDVVKRPEWVAARVTELLVTLAPE